jgi:hypothetical protein
MPALRPLTSQHPPPTLFVDYRERGHLQIR